MSDTWSKEKCAMSILGILLGRVKNAFQSPSYKIEAICGSFARIGFRQILSAPQASLLNMGQITRIALSEDPCLSVKIS